MTGDNQPQDRFFELLRPELPRLQAFCQKLVGDSDQGDDLVQDALYDAWKGFGCLRDDAAFKSWLYRVVINRYRTNRRRLKKRPDSTVPLTGDVVDAEELRMRMVRERLDIAMACLSGKDRTLVTLRELEGWPYSELAALLGRREGALRTRLVRCRIRMRETLRAYLERSAEVRIRDWSTGKCVAEKPERS